MKNKTLRTCVRHRRTVISRREGQTETTICFQYGADDIAAAVILAVQPITHTHVVVSVVPARAQWLQHY